MSSGISQQQLQALPDFPNQQSQIKPGRYVVRHEQESDLASETNQVEHKIWFQSPPLKAETIKRIDRVQLGAESHDQGFADDESAGNWTWLEIAILESEKDTTPKFKDKVELVWISHPNHFKKEDFEWGWGRAFSSRDDFLGLLEEGNVIAIRLCARFPGWEIVAKNGYLVFDFGETRKQETVGYGKVVTDVENITSIINVVNAQTQPPTSFRAVSTDSLLRADVMTTNGLPLRVLSLDGGGARGLSSLYLLDAVMDRIGKGKKPCEIFDMIGGTSTGGLIAIMLGRLKMSVKDCIVEYNKVMDKIFVPHWDITKAALIAKGSQVYDATKLEEVIKNLVKAKLGDADAKLLDESKENTCKVFVMAVYEDAPNNRAPIYLRSYKNQYEDTLLPQVRSVLPNIKIWEAARATSAAPTYFKSITVGNYTLLDGGLGANNPLGWLWLEVWAIYGPRRSTDCFLSIGTGIPANKSLNGIVNLTKNMSSVATSSEITHLLFRTLINAYAPNPCEDKYWRLNIGTRLAEWDETHKSFFGGSTVEKHLDDYEDPGDMDDLKSLPKLVELTKTYINDQKAAIEQCGDKLRGYLRQV